MTKTAILMLLLSFNDYGADPMELHERAVVLAAQTEDRIPLLLGLSWVESRHDPTADNGMAFGFYQLKPGKYGNPPAHVLRWQPWAELMATLYRLEEGRRMCGRAALDYYNGGGGLCWTRGSSTCEGDACGSFGRKVRARSKFYREHLKRGPVEVLECPDSTGVVYRVGVYRGQDRAQVLKRATSAGLDCH